MPPSPDHDDDRFVAPEPEPPLWWPVEPGNAGVVEHLENPGNTENPDDRVLTTGAGTAATDRDEVLVPAAAVGPEAGSAAAPAAMPMAAGDVPGPGPSLDKPLPVEPAEPDPGPQSGPVTGDKDDGNGHEPPIPSAEEPFGWDFEEVGTHDLAYDYIPQKRRRPIWIPLTAGAICLAAVLGVTFFLVAWDGEQTPAAHPTTAAPIPATPVAGEQLEALRPRKVTVAPFDGRVMVSWVAPLQSDQVIGYFVVSQTPEGQLLEHVGSAADDTTAVLTSANAGRNCVVVTTVVSGTPSLMLARSEPLCPGDAPADPQNSPSSAAGSASASTPGQPDRD